LGALERANLNHWHHMLEIHVKGKFGKAVHEDIWGSGGIASPFLTLALDESEWSASSPCRFTPQGKSPGTYWIGGWVGPESVWTL
jgi:hypothetical protein